MTWIAVFYLCVGAKCGFIYSEPLTSRGVCEELIAEDKQVFLARGADHVDAACIEAPTGTMVGYPGGY